MGSFSAAEGLFVWALFWIGIPVAIFLFARGLLRAIERRSTAERQLTELTSQLQRLQMRLGDVVDASARLPQDEPWSLHAAHDGTSGGMPSSTGTRDRDAG